jgi:hypothetical protein
MAQRTIARMYDDYGQAQKVVNELEAAGIPHSDISLVANDTTRRDSSGVASDDRTTTTETAAGTGATIGTVLGGGAGLLAGLGALAIPGVGPVVAAGWLVAALTGAGIGAASGGLLGALTGAGLSKDEADVYAEGVRGGGSLVSVRADEADAARVEEVMGRHGPVDWQERRASYGPEWKGFDETSHTRVRKYTAPSESGVGTGSGIETGSDVPDTGAGGSYAPGTDPGRRL